MSTAKKTAIVTGGSRGIGFGIPMGYVYLIMPVSGVLIVLYNIINLMELAYVSRTETRRTV